MSGLYGLPGGKTSTWKVGHAAFSNLRHRMTAQQVERLIEEWGESPGPPVFPDPWGNPGFGQVGAAPRDPLRREDVGWKLAARFAKTGRKPAILREPVFAAVRVAAEILSGASPSPKDAKLAAAVAEAWDLHSDRTQAVIVEALLMTHGATAESVAAVLGIDTAVVESYTALFFNVPDRQDDLPYLLGIVRDEESAEARNLLEVGLNGTVADVLQAAGCGGRTGAESASALADRVKRNMLAAGAAWTSAPGSGTPPPLAAQAITFIGRPSSESAASQDSGEPGEFSRLLAAQLGLDRAHLNNAVAGNGRPAPNTDNGDPK